jgi:hypothetical protein
MEVKFATLSKTDMPDSEPTFPGDVEVAELSALRRKLVKVPMLYETRELCFRIGRDWSTTLAS